MWKIVQELAIIALLCLVVGIGVYMVSTESPWTPPTSASPEEGSAVSQPGEEDRIDFLSHGGRQRQYLVHVPHARSGGGLLPVVLAFHAAQSNASELRAQSRLNEVADAHGFLVVYPEGVEWTFNVGTGYGFALSRAVDEVGFTSALIDDLVRKYGADGRRIYATGLGNGAMLCQVLAARLPQRIAAIAPVEGDLPTGKEIDDSPAVPVPVLEFHGLQDPRVPFGGGLGTQDVQPVLHRPIRQTIDWWVKRNRCGSQPVETVEKKDYVYTRYAPSAEKEGAPVIL